MINLGNKYQDTVTGFEGTATAETRYFCANARVLLESRNGDGVVEEKWFDVDRLQRLDGQG